MTSIVTRLETTSRCGHETRKERCGIPRASHRGAGHKYVLSWLRQDSQLIVLCSKPSCGVGAFSEVYPHRFPEFHGALTSIGWRIIGGEWHCPQCVTKFDKREAKKRDPRQASFMEE